MSVQNHLVIILEKSDAARIRADRTYRAADLADGVIKALEMTPEMEAALEPLFEALENVPTPTVPEYEDIDDILSEIEDILDY